MGRRDMKKDILRILIIEDNIDHVELLSQVIERHFAPVDLHTVESVDDAMDFIEQTNYDIALTDCYINNESIIDQIPALRARLGETPLIVVTGSGDETLAADVIKKGATDYLVKTKASLEKIPAIINKYSSQKGRANKQSTKKPDSAAPIKVKLLHEVSMLDRKAEHMTSAHGGKIPDIKQLETLINQIQRLKELISKLVDK